MNWVLATLDSLPMEIIDGDRSAKYPKREEFRAEGMPFLNSTNIVDNRLDLSETNFVSMEKYSQIRKGRFQAGDILMTTRGSIGKVAWIPPGLKGLINAQMLILRVDPNVLDDRFLFSVLSSADAQKSLKNFASGSAQPQIPIRDLRQISIRIPDLATQRRIASILSAYDDLIENNTRRIAILEEMAQRLYEEWFVRFRFPGHEDVPMIESELGLVPQGWQVTTLGQLAEVNARSVRRGAEPTEVQYIDISSVSTGSIDKKERMLFADAPGRARRVVRDGDVIWACVRPNRKSYSLVLNPEPNLLVSTGFAVLSPVAVPCSFLYQCVTTKDFVSHLVNHAKGATYPAVSAADFDNAKVLKPSNNLVVDFDKLAEPMMRLVAALQLKNANLRTTRDLLLPKLISGELDVSTLAEPLAQTL